MRIRNHIVLFFLPLFVGAQTGVEFGNYDPFFDTTQYLRAHSAIKPTMRSNPTFSKKDELTVFPVVNQLGAIVKTEEGMSHSLRSGIGVGVNGYIGENLYVKAMLTGSYFERDSIVDNRYSILPNTYFWNGNEKVRREIQPMIRASYTPNKFFNFQAGIDNNFIGEGERSLILGDVHAPYPFVQIRSSLWRFEFVNIYQLLREGPHQDRITKYTSSHYLNFQATKRLQVGVFESVIFDPTDGGNLKRGFEWEYLNPFLFYRPTEYSIGSQDKIILGTNFSYNLDFLMLYGQFVLDDFVLNELLNRTRWWANKYAGQFGFKGKKVTSNNHQVNYLSEINFARPFIYAHNTPSTNYGHQGIALAHPLGANFVEVYSRLEMNFKNNLKISADIMFSQQGGQAEDQHPNHGQDIYWNYIDRPFEYGYRIGGNGKLNRWRTSIEVSYTVFPQYRINAFVRPIIEQRGGIDDQQILLFFAGIRSDLWTERAFRF